jgi:choline kinase
MKGVILAAGDGGRLRPLTQEQPKVLLRVNGRPLISYPIEALVMAGVTDIAVVVGYQASRVMAELSQCAPEGARFEFIPNPQYMGGNAISVHVAREFVGGSNFVLCMGDHIIDQGVVCRLLDGEPIAPILCVDSAPTMESQTNDATRVLIGSNGLITSIGKHLPTWNAVDTGTFLLNSDVFEVIDELQVEHGSEVEMSQAVEALIAYGAPFRTCDIQGLFWTDVDTPEDYESTARALGYSHGLRL